MINNKIRRLEDLHLSQKEVRSHDAAATHFSGTSTAFGHPVLCSQPMANKQTDCLRDQSKKGQDPAVCKSKKSHAGDTDAQEPQDACCVAIEKSSEKHCL